MLVLLAAYVTVSSLLILGCGKSGKAEASNSKSSTRPAAGPLRSCNSTPEAGSRTKENVSPVAGTGTEKRDSDSTADGKAIAKLGTESEVTKESNVEKASQIEKKMATARNEDQEEEKKKPKVEEKKNAAVKKEKKRSHVVQQKDTKDAGEKMDPTQEVSLVAQPDPIRAVAEQTKPSLVLSTDTCRWTEAGGQQTVTVTNNSTIHCAVKIKCSDNKLFVITPVFHVLQPGKQLNVVITRMPGALKRDKVVICWAQCSATDKDLSKFFKRQDLNMATMDIAQQGESHSLVAV